MEAVVVQAVKDREGKCIHHWKIEQPEPEIPTVRGICKKCGEEKFFRAFQDWTVTQWRDY